MTTSLGPRYEVRAGATSTEYRTLLQAMRVARELLQAGHRGVSVVDRRAAVVWRADRLGLGALLELDREAAQRSAAHYALLATARGETRQHSRRLARSIASGDSGGRA